MRAGGQIPAVLYGHGIETTQSIILEPRALGKALENPKGANGLVALDVDGLGQHTVLVREIQRHPVSRKILHVDLVSPDPDVELVATVPVSFFGKSPGVSLGGALRTPYRELKLISRPGSIPAEIAVDLSSLEMGDAVMASELTLPEGASILTEVDFLIAKVIKPRGKAEGEGDEEGAEGASDGDADSSEAEATE